MDKPDINKLKEFESLAIATGNLTDIEVTELIEANRRLIELDSIADRSAEQYMEFAQLLKRSGDLTLKSQVSNKSKENSALMNRAYGLVVVIFAVVVGILYFLNKMNS
jgi:hypothetical protein